MVPDEREWEMYRPTKVDFKKIATMWTKAFLEYPSYKHIIPDEDDRKKLLPLGMDVVTRFGFIYGTFAATSPEMEGVFLYLTPEQLPITTWKMIRSGMLKLIFKWPWKYCSRWLKLLDFQDAKLKVHAPKHFTYLANGAVEPGKQRAGIGSGFLKSIIVNMDKKGMGCYGETFEKSNAKLYDRIGLKVVAEYAVPESEMTMYCLAHEVGDPL
jgi:hypothetical protein